MSKRFQHIAFVASHTPEAREAYGRLEKRYGNADPAKAGCKLLAHLKMPRVPAFINPLLYAIPVQLLAYHTAVFMGTDVDQPRNLAKSVTVE